VKITPFVTEYLLPLLACPCCGKVNAARPPAGAYPGSICYGPGINTAAVLLSSYGNVPSERTAKLIGRNRSSPPTPEWTPSVGVLPTRGYRVHSACPYRGGLVHTQTCVGSRALWAAATRSAWTESRSTSTVSFSRAANAAMAGRRHTGRG
jgi:hypothetical protein